MATHSKLTPRPSDIDHWRWLPPSFKGGVKGKVTLDIGCGSGYIPSTLAAHGARAIGVDLVRPPAIGEREPEGWTFVQLDLAIKDWSHRVGTPGFIQLITAFDIIEHLDHPMGLIKECHTLLHPDGWLVLTTPNVNSWERWLRPKTWSGAHDPDHIVLWTLYSLRFALERSGFVIHTLKAPIRTFGPMSPFVPQVGGQILCLARKAPR